jgi:hypothetical protein
MIPINSVSQFSEDAALTFSIASQHNSWAFLTVLLNAQGRGIK